MPYFEKFRNRKLQQGAPTPLNRKIPIHNCMSQLAVSTFYERKLNRQAFPPFSWQSANPFAEEQGYGRKTLLEVVRTKRKTPLSFETRFFINQSMVPLLSHF
jgi:hypothetical protein